VLTVDGCLESGYCQKLVKDLERRESGLQMCDYMKLLKVLSTGQVMVPHPPEDELH